jgi:hypothetical protein
MFNFFAVLDYTADRCYMYNEINKILVHQIIDKTEINKILLYLIIPLARETKDFVTLLSGNRQ